MAPTRPDRPSTPPPRASTVEFGHPDLGPPPSTPIRSNTFHSNSNFILGSEHAMVPPSPGVPVPGFEALSVSSDAGPGLPTGKSRYKKNAKTRAGIKKTQAKKKPDGTVAKLVEAAMTEKFGARENTIEKPFRFMDLPGELRNEIYKHTHGKPKQALLVRRPRLATLRERTRLDRGRTLASDIIGQEQDEQLSTKKSAKSKDKPKRESNRPFWGLTFVCRQIRHEFRPIYMQRQEIGMDLTEIVDYLAVYYPTAAADIANLAPPGERAGDLPFVGNLTIAVGDKPNELETSPEGIEIYPLLDIWANSFKIEAGFGRYLKANYVPETDGEAKDLYRLFGRRVLRNRSCSAMNNPWRSILRSRQLASVRVHRKPAPPAPGLGAAPIVARARGALTARVATAPVAAAQSAAPLVTKPYLHIIFKKDTAEPWMTAFESVIPKNPDWLAEHGFGNMEYFDVRVGVEQDAAT